MKIFTNNGNNTSFDIIHLKGTKEDYSIIEDDGKLVYESTDLDRKYIVDNVEVLHFKYPDQSTNSNEYRFKNEFETFGIKDSCQSWFDSGYTECGLYNITNNSLIKKMYCSNGYIDLIKTFENDDSIEMRDLFFGGNVTSKPIQSSNGFYMTYEKLNAANIHSIPIYLFPNKFITISEIDMEWTIQGSDDNNSRCSNGSTPGNWIPLNGPGFNGGYDGYYAPVPNGYTAIQGSCEESRDAPLEQVPYLENNIPSNRIYVWSGSGDITSSENCAKSALIPVNLVAISFHKLLIK